MAEEIKNPAPQEENVDTGTEPAEKTYTQEEIDSLVEKRLSRERRKHENDPDYKAFKEWQKTQKTDEERNAERDKELADTKNEIAMLRAEKKVIGANAKPEFAEFIASKVLLMGEDFDKNLADYKKNNPHFFGETVVKKVSSAPTLGGRSEEGTTNQKMNDLIRGARN